MIGEYERLPPEILLSAYEMKWIQAFGSNASWVYESTDGGKYNPKARRYKDLCRNADALDDLVLLDDLLERLGAAVHNGHAWRRTVRELLIRLDEDDLT